MARYSNLILSGTKARPDKETEGVAGNDLFLKLENNLVVSLGTMSREDLINLAIEKWAKMLDHVPSDAETKAYYEKAREILEQEDQQAEFKELTKKRTTYGRPGPYGMAVPDGYLIEGYKEGKYDKRKDYILHKGMAHELQSE